MNEVAMSRVILTKVDRMINYLTLSFIIGGGMAIHLLTSLTLSHYYGTKWGYLAFFLPGPAEVYLLSLQINEEMYNYMLILGGFATVAVTLGAVWYLKNIVKSKVMA